MKLLPLVPLAFLATSILVPSLPAQVVTPSPAPTIITTAPYTITKSGFYQLGANLSYVGNGSSNDAIITINASNVTSAAPAATRPPSSTASMPMNAAI